MTLLAAGLVLLSAALHATWNLLAKRVQGNAAFIWLYEALALAILTPAVLIFLLLAHPAVTLWSFVFMFGSGLLEVIYFVLLQRGYRVGDLSLVYPVARGTGPMLATIVAILVLKEHPTPLALFGTACILVGIVLIAWKPQRLNDARARLALLYGVLTGCCIAGYTLWDKEALTIGGLAPLLLYFGGMTVQVAALSPFALRHRQTVAFHWRAHKLDALGIAVLSTITYLIVLSALVFTPVSYIAPFREVSVLFGALLGTQLLKESEVKRRLLAACVMVVGIVALAL